MTVKERLEQARPIGFAEAVCSCGSDAIAGRCIRCGTLVCGSCAVAAGSGVCCEPCRWGVA